MLYIILVQGLKLILLNFLTDPVLNVSCILCLTLVMCNLHVCYFLTLQLYIQVCSIYMCVISPFRSMCSCRGRNRKDYFMVRVSYLFQMWYLQSRQWSSMCALRVHEQGVDRIFQLFSLSFFWHYTWQLKCRGALEWF